MPLGNPVEQALANFNLNKAEAERQLALQKAQLGDHEHGRLCFSWRQCRKHGALIVGLSERMPRYDAAIEGLQTGDYAPAVSLLDEVIPQLEESPDDVVARVRRDHSLGTNTMARLERSPTYIQAGVISLRNELAGLIPQDPS